MDKVCLYDSAPTENTIEEKTAPETPKRTRQRKVAPDYLKELKKAFAVALRADWKMRFVKVRENPPAKRLKDYTDSANAWESVAYSAAERAKVCKQLALLEHEKLNPLKQSEPTETPEPVVASALGGV
jgi:hypothetical protein